MRKRILYVEDLEEWRSMVSSLLSPEGFEVVTAKDASEAMHAFDSAQFNLLILDLRLNRESGIMLMRFLKKNHPEVPILIYTSLDHDDFTIDHLLKEGADRYLHKGKMEELLAAVCSMTGGKKS
jgi:DNA-binding response OmpR family regulator